MKQYQINNACNALERLINMQLRMRDSRNIYMLSKQLEDAYNFEIEQERKLISKYHGEITQNGLVHFPTPADGDGFKKEIAELNNLDVEVDFDPVTINCDGLDDQLITPRDIALLDGFVVFE